MVQKRTTIILLILFLLVIIGGWLYSVYRKGYEEKVMKSGKNIKTWAVYFDDREGKGIVGTKFYYLNQSGKRIEFDQHRYYKSLSFGDTVTIQYSTIDNSVVKILKLKWDSR